jgi:hypothetical protein
MTCLGILHGRGIWKSLYAKKRPIFYPKLDETVKMENIKIPIIVKNLNLTSNNQLLTKNNKHMLLEKGMNFLFNVSNLKEWWLIVKVQHETFY